MRYINAHLFSYIWCILNKIPFRDEATQHTIAAMMKVYDIRFFLSKISPTIFLQFPTIILPYKYIYGINVTIYSLILNYPLKGYINIRNHI